MSVKSTTHALEIAAAIRNGQTSATALVTATLDQIAQRNPQLNCFTTVVADRAIATAQRLDQRLGAGDPVGPLAGVPFAVKNLFDIRGQITLAGAKISEDNPPATTDATAITRLEEAGAILIGALNMDEYAYGFVTINAHSGPTPNPHDPSRVAGGSSGGSAAAVAAGLVPLTLGSDTNGSIRVPAALCGVYGLKPTYGKLSRAGAYLFSSSLDHIGPFAQTVPDLAATFDAMQGPDPRDPVCSNAPAEPATPQLDRGLDGLRLAIAGDHFARGMDEAVAAGLAQVVAALGVTDSVTLPEAARARAAAYVLTACEGSNLHLARLQARPMDFDPATRDRFLAGALIPASWYVQAQRFRRWYCDRISQIFNSVDVLIAPTTPCVAPRIDQRTMTIAGQEVLVRPHLGLYTQPLSFIGLPVLSVPVAQASPLPVGVQLIAAPHCEAKLLRVAAVLADLGVTKSGVVAES